MHPLQRPVTTERRRQLPFCLAPSMVALILALAGVARLAPALAGLRISAMPVRLGPLGALANAKIHSNATHPSISKVS